MTRTLSLVVCSDTVACSSCGLKTMYLWDGLIHDLESMERVSLCFIFMPLQKDLEEFYFTMRTMAPVASCACGYGRIFIRRIIFRGEAVYHTFLLDKEDNRVVLVEIHQKLRR